MGFLLQSLGLQIYYVYEKYYSRNTFVSELFKESAHVWFYAQTLTHYFKFIEFIDLILINLYYINYIVNLLMFIKNLYLQSFS